MKTTRKWDCLLRGASGFIWATVGLIFVSLALGYKAWLVHEQANLGEILFWLFLAAWGKALAIGVVGLFLILVIIRALRTCQEKILSSEGRRENIRIPRSLTVGRVHAGGARHS
jgi:hypothetical protein